jgi:hypothetical protein
MLFSFPMLPQTARGQRFLCDSGIKGNLLFGTILFYDIQLLREIRELKSTPEPGPTFLDFINKVEALIERCANFCAKTCNWKIHTFIKIWLVG